MIESKDAKGADDTILDIQSAFAELISRHFSDLWLCYSKGDLDIQKTVLQYVNNPSGIVIPRLSRITTALFRRVEDLLLDIDTFWVKHTDGLKDAISRSGRFGVLIGDIDAVPDDYEDCILRLGLYFDTVYLVEPLSVFAQRVKSEPTLLAGDRYTMFVLRLLWTFLRIRELVEQIPLRGSRLVAAFVPIIDENRDSQKFGQKI